MPPKAKPSALRSRSAASRYERRKRRLVLSQETRDFRQAQPDMFEVGIGCERFSNAQLLHDDERSKICKRDLWLVVIAVPKLPCLLKSLRGDPFQLEVSCRYGFPDRLFHVCRSTASSSQVAIEDFVEILCETAVLEHAEPFDQRILHVLTPYCLRPRSYGLKGIFRFLNGPPLPSSPSKALVPHRHRAGSLPSGP